MIELPVVFVGLPGTGKSAVAEQIGARTGRDVISIDQQIVETAGTSIAEFFETKGEAAFRALEAKLLRQAFEASPNVIIDGGGGVVTQPENRQLIRDQGVAVWLDAPNEVLIDRLGSDDTRPLLAVDPVASLAKLRRDRLVNYTTVADVIVPTEQSSVVEVVNRVLSQLAQFQPTGRATAGDPDAGTDVLVDGLRVENVELGDDRRYPVVIGRGARHRLTGLIPDQVKRVAVITQPDIPFEVETGREQQTFIVPDGEDAKRLETVGQLCSSMAEWGMTRSDAVVSVGGGVVSDLAGFVAASYHRGIPVIHVSTTLLGQIDAAIGGKCGVNLPEGKNLVGAFWQPAAVVCDTETLETLPTREFVSGMGELAKYHFLGGGDLANATLDERVARSVRIKADVVGADEREGGRRAILNYGHTLAHALETAGGYDLRHGEAVGIGLVYAAEVARRLGRLDQAAVERHRAVVHRYGLDHRIPPGFDLEHLVQLFSRDKKAIDGITFVLDGPNGVEPVQLNDHQLLLDAFDAVSG